jgi:glycosyltransferase involved in cell wall biosynthesis
VIEQPHQGAAAARNTAYSHCQGDYVQWLDGNDVLAPDKLERLIAARAQRHGPRTLLSCAWGRFLYRHRRADFEPTALWCDLSPAEWLLRKVEHNIYMQTATWLVSRELAQAAGPWDTSLSVDDDGEYFSRVLLFSDGVRFVPDAKVFYRRSGTGRVSHIGRSNEKMDAQLRSMELTIRYLRSLDDGPRARAACRTYLQNWLINFYPNRPDIVEHLERMAVDLGGRLDPPRLSWKYSWMASAFGMDVAKRAQILLPAIKWSLVRLWDKALFRLENLRAPRAAAAR